MSAWLDDRQRDPVRFPHIPHSLARAVSYQRDRCRRIIWGLRYFQSAQHQDILHHRLPFAWRDYRGLMAKVGQINKNLKARREA